MQQQVYPPMPSCWQASTHFWAYFSAAFGPPATIAAKNAWVASSAAVQLASSQAATQALAEAPPCPTARTNASPAALPWHSWSVAACKRAAATGVVPALVQAYMGTAPGGLWISAAQGAGLPRTKRCVATRPGQAAAAAVAMAGLLVERASCSFQA